MPDGEHAVGARCFPSAPPAQRFKVAGGGGADLKHFALPMPQSAPESLSGWVKPMLLAQQPLLGPKDGPGSYPLPARRYGICCFGPPNSH